MPRTAFTIFGIDIYWYAILITSAILIGYLWAKVHNGRYNINYDDVFTLSIFMIPIAIICARIYYVAFKWDYYGSNIEEILDFRNGGIAIYGALIGAVVTICVFCKIRKIKILDLLDYLAPIIPLCQAIGRWGNYINIEAYGTETNWPIRMEIIEKGVTKYVHPTFLYESVGNLVVFFVLYKLSKNRKFSGQVVCLYFMGYALVRFFVEGLRTDSLMLGTIRVSQILSLILLFACSILYFYRIRKTKKELI
ncbi:MAG: prolipoprotein diacylglyceryl transferase [Clostridia bacterium]|nr:prolipoprotein diacylglyceryl transferase [Clostridia bacterium]